MKGFKVFFKGEQIDIAPEFDARLFISCRNGHYEILASGLVKDFNNDSIIHTWIESSMEIGDEVEIEVVDIGESAHPISIKKTFSYLEPLSKTKIKEMWADKLEYFSSLEQLLIREGVLSENIDVHQG